VTWKRRTTSSPFFKPKYTNQDFYGKDGSLNRIPLMQVKLLTASGAVTAAVSNSTAEGVLVDLSSANHDSGSKTEETTSKESEEGEVQVLKGLFGSSSSNIDLKPVAHTVCPPLLCRQTTALRVVADEMQGEH